MGDQCVCHKIDSIPTSGFCSYCSLYFSHNLHGFFPHITENCTQIFSDHSISKSCTLTLIILYSLVFFIPLTTIISVHVFFNNRYSNTCRMNGLKNGEHWYVLLFYYVCHASKTDLLILLYFSTTFFLHFPLPGMLSSPFLCLFKSCL